jgi:phospholipid/cholesterol/gamma-HCH transport system permease protein
MTDSTPGYALEQGENGWVLRLSGDWRLPNLATLDRELGRLPALGEYPVTVQGGGLAGLDSAGVMMLVRRLEAAGAAWSRVALEGFGPQHRALVGLVAERLQAPPQVAAAQTGLLHAVGRQAVNLLRETVARLAFLGRIAESLGDLAMRPGLFRSREFLVQLEVVGLGALFIVALMTFLIGVVFAFLLGIQIEKFGANIFIVDGVALAVTRELAPLLTAILVAGRSGAAFTAQIGAMKVTEEIDAIATLGLSPLQVLVLPRLLAIVAVMPLLAFVGDAMGVLGASLVASSQLDITFYTFFARMKDVLPLGTVLFGLGKTPVFAAAIAFIACHNGFAVSRDARSVGARTTATVVQSLVAVILIDAAFAIAFPEIVP